MTLPVDSKGAAIDGVLEKLLVKGIRFGADSKKRFPDDYADEAKALAAQAILAILAQEVKRVIGADDKQKRAEEDDGMLWCTTCEVVLSDLTAPEYACNCTVRNELRAEQRRKAGLV